MMSPNRVASIMQPFLVVLLIWFVLVVLYGFVSREDDYDDTVTVTFRCENVLLNQNNYPDFVIEQCKNIRRR